MIEPIRVLVVDDNEDARHFLRRVLSIEESIEIVEMVDDGNVAVEYCVTEEPPHVVLMDLNMPHMDGITACSVIRTAAPATQVIMLSVQDDSRSIRDAIDAGAAAFLVKPVVPDDLIDLIHRAYAAYQSISSATM